MKTDYKYDLISGNVNQVNYQSGKADEFHYRYEYDANNRLTNSYSSKDGEIWEKESKNFYYAHGPLARQEIGDEIVQACDYVYTINGWLKAVNSSINSYLNDAGEDGKSSEINRFIGRDAASFSLHYFANDFTSTNESSTGNLLANIDHTNFGNTAHDLYNGNIHQMITSLNDIDENPLGVLANKYRYDQLQRIKNSNVFQGEDIRDNNQVVTDLANDIWQYRSAYSFDGNGNLLGLSRTATAFLGDGPLPGMDALSYHYDYHAYDPSDPDDTDGIEPKTTNQLLYVEDFINPDGSSPIEGDVENQDPGNYVYDEIGQLTFDRSNDISNITWTVTGKVKRITYEDALNSDVSTSVRFIDFEYDPMGNRISKKVYHHYSVDPVDESITTEVSTTTYYMHDASGNVIATYIHEIDELSSAPEVLTLKEHHLYGSKRLGISNEHLDLTATYSPTNDYQRVLGNKSYELSNHLGNVLVTVSDRKLPVENTFVGGSGTVNFYQADVKSHQEYFPYGMVLPGRSGSEGDNYRFGFQGQEVDDEVKGENNSVNYKYRMHDPRIGRFFAVDPLTSKYPHYSPYQFSGNKVIQFVELEGLEEGQHSLSYNQPQVLSGHVTVSRS